MGVMDKFLNYMKLNGEDESTMMKTIWMMKKR